MLAGLLNWFVSPYVHRLDFDRKSRLLKVKTLNVLAQERQNHFPESDLRFPDTMRPQVTFEVKPYDYQWQIVRICTMRGKISSV